MEQRAPRYYLYGESTPADGLEFVHCTPIFSRIVEQNYEIRPHRHSQLVQFLILESGSMHCLLDTDETELSGPCLVSIPPQSIHGFSYQPAAKGRIITVAESFLRSNASSSDDEILNRILSRIWHVILDAESAEHKQLRSISESIESELDQPRPAQVQVMSALLTLLMVSITRHTYATQLSAKTDSNYEKLFLQFQKLVEHHYVEHWPVSRYADKLGVNQRRLNRAVNHATGTGASRFIQDRLIQEAKRSLVYTVMPATQVCFELGFKDPGYFSRFFSRNVGTSPSEFARRHHR